MVDFTDFTSFSANFTQFFFRRLSLVGTVYFTGLKEHGGRTFGAV